MARKLCDDDKESQFLDESERGGRGQIWMACVCLCLSLVCSALWLVLLLAPQ